MKFNKIIIIIKNLLKYLDFLVNNKKNFNMNNKMQLQKIIYEKLIKMMQKNQIENPTKLRVI